VVKTVLQRNASPFRTTRPFPPHQVLPNPLFTDGREAYRLLKSDADFKIAIFNMTMPNLRGLDIVRYMKTEKRLMRIPVLVVSGEPGLKQMSDSFAAGATVFLAKPFTPDQLQRTLRIALSSRESQRQFQCAA